MVVCLCYHPNRIHGIVLLSIIVEKENRGMLLPDPYWNETIGWGHIIANDDRDYTLHLNEWKLFDLWNFHGAFTDQGLLYHWVKYVEKSASIGTSTIVSISLRI